MLSMSIKHKNQAQVLHFPVKTDLSEICWNRDSIAGEFPLNFTKYFQVAALEMVSEELFLSWTVFSFPIFVEKVLV